MRCLFIAATAFAAFVPLLNAEGWMRGYKIGYFSSGYSVRQTLDGGYIVTGGYMPTFDSPGDLFLLKTNESGDSMWLRVYGGDMSDEGHCVQQTKDGGYIVFGFANEEQFPMPVGDLWLLKTDAKGDTLWTKLYRGGSYTWGGWVEQTSDGGYIITSNWNSAYLLLLKTDKDGNTEWSKNYQWGDVQEIGYCVRQTTDGGYIVATSLGLFKTNDKGDSLWLKPWISKCVEQTSDSGYILATEHNNDIWLIKTDLKGDTLWTRTYGGDSVDVSCDVHQTKDGGYVIIGASGSFGGIWLLKTEANGDTTWTRIIKAGDVNSGEQTSDGGYIIAGSRHSLERMAEVLLIKTDSLGYVGVEEPVPVTHLADWEVVNAIGQVVTLKYHDKPGGFHAKIYDASGRKVDEIRSTSSSGSISWGAGMSSGVYFILIAKGARGKATRIILLP